jgi:anti-sigma factor RsiW
MYQGRLLMSCNLTHSDLHGYFDGELNAVGAAEFKHHLAHCSDCMNELAALSAFRDSLRHARLYEPAPVSLVRKIRADLYSVSPKIRPSSQHAWRGLAAAVGLLIVILGLWRVMPGVRKEQDDQAEYAAEIVDAHRRSLIPGQATNVNSTDPQRVRAWLERKVQFAVPVRDFANNGFALQGGRVDIVEGRTVAALVYREGDELFNVFIWRTSESDGSPRVGSREGYHWIAWRKDKLEFCTVSDAAPADLGRLHQLLTE